jgi:hypothetical protein
VRHAHPVERSVGDASGCIEIGVQVEVDKADGAQRGDRLDGPDADRAVAAQHQGELLIAEHGDDAARRLLDDAHHSEEVLREGVVAVRPPAR